MPFLLTMKDAVLRIQEESARLSAWLAERTGEAVVSSGGNFVEMSRRLLKQMSETERGYIIGKWVSRLCRGGKAHADMIIKSLEQRDSVRFSLPLGFVSETSADSVRVFPADWVKPYNYIKPPALSAIQLPERNIQINFPESLKGRRLIVRSRTDGDRFHGEKLKKLFSDAKLPLILRDRAVVVAEAESNKPIWVEYIETKEGDFAVILKEMREQNK
jgi:tRNA(Ile)-lysidine synthetase-like protein